MTVKKIQPLKIEVKRGLSPPPAHRLLDLRIHQEPPVPTTFGFIMDRFGLNFRKLKLKAQSKARKKFLLFKSMYDKQYVKKKVNEIQFNRMSFGAIKRMRAENNRNAYRDETSMKMTDFFSRRDRM